MEPARLEEEGPTGSHSSLLVVQPPVDPRRARPTVVLHIHLSEEALLAHLAGSSCGAGVARIEQVGPVTLGQVRRFLNRAGCDIRVLPVIDPVETPPADSYEIPRRLREAVFLQTPASVFPWGTGTSRRMDLDHTIPYLPPSRGGPPGQTAMDNLGPLSRSEHRLKTPGRWRVRQPVEGPRPERLRRHHLARSRPTPTNHRNRGVTMGHDCARLVQQPVELTKQSNAEICWPTGRRFGEVEVAQPAARRPCDTVSHMYRTTLLT